MDAAVDGNFLYDLNDDDLKNTLGIEHRLHRKKILNMVQRLKAAEAERNKQMKLSMAQERAAALGLPMPVSGPGDEYLAMANQQQQAPAAAAGAIVAVSGATAEQAVEDVERPPLVLDELIGWVRHSKYKKLREAFDHLPNKRFDPQLVKAPYVEDFGTAYLDAYEREAFNLNKMDEFGNTLMLIASQNGNEKIAKLLVEKGANPNHQNRQGQTSGHFANSYGFWDLLSWLFDPEGAGADDTLLNRFGLGVYDGLSAALEGGEEEEED